MAFKLLLLLGEKIHSVHQFQEHIRFFELLSYHNEYLYKGRTTCSQTHRSSSVVIFIVRHHTQERTNTKGKFGIHN